jgi:hypothetical protein
MAIAPRFVQANLALAGKPNHANQELLYALVGITGDVFVDDLENVAPQHGFHAPSQCSYHIATDISWLSASDCKLIDQILTTGFHYRQIERFVRDQQENANTISCDVCWLALATGLDGAPAAVPLLLTSWNNRECNPTGRHSLRPVTTLALACSCWPAI